MLLKITRAIIIFHLLLAGWWLYSLLSYKGDWEMGETFGFLFDIGMFAYNIVLLVAAFIIKRKWPVRIVFGLAIAPWAIILLWIIYALIFTHPG